MATPAPKSKAMNDIYTALMGRDREATIKANLCMVCAGRADTFKDAASQLEYTISGMCQVCQDKTFG